MIEPVSLADYCYMRMVTRQALDHAQFREAITYPAAQGLLAVGKPEDDINAIDDPTAIEYRVRVVAGGAHAGTLFVPNRRHAQAIALSLSTAVAHGYIVGKFRFRDAGESEREALTGTAAPKRSPKCTRRRPMRRTKCYRRSWMRRRHGTAERSHNDGGKAMKTLAALAATLAILSGWSAAARAQGVVERWTTVENQQCETWRGPVAPQYTVTWEGDCVDGMTSGRGRAVWRSRDRKVVFEGEHRAGKRHGQGVMTYSDGRRYEGRFSPENSPRG